VWLLGGAGGKIFDLERDLGFFEILEFLLILDLGLDFDLSFFGIFLLLLEDVSSLFKGATIDFLDFFRFNFFLLPLFFKLSLSNFLGATLASNYSQSGTNISSSLTSSSFTLGG
jgi:hypothetical protein